MSNSEKRVRVAILGGGLHGLRILSELKRHGWDDVVLFEQKPLEEMFVKNNLMEIESLFSLFNLNDFKLISSLLSEVSAIKEAFPGSVSKAEFVMPLFQKKFGDILFHRFTFFIYNQLIRGSDLNSIRRMIKNHYADFGVYPKKQVSYYLIDDYIIDMISLHNAVYKDTKHFLSSISQASKVHSLKPNQDGWTIKYVDEKQREKKISALYVINALGPDAYNFLKKNSLQVGTVGYSYRRYFKLEGSVIPLAAALLTQDGLRASLKVIPKDERSLYLISQDHLTIQSPVKRDGFLSRSDQKWQSHLQSYLNLSMENYDIQSLGASIRAIQLESAASSSVQTDLKSNQSYAEQRSGRGTLISLFEPSSLRFRQVALAICSRIFHLFGYEDVL